ncbi:pyridoxamine 5'-phosphate oxidase family protein [uncultured Maribacter sp.]|uniref:pyridoxamine 5'-phosphate oxidase family protein n=1 Tax=uncultured Maribacter sp. TaxID=431308 RepID=UPI00261F52DC|nr:pyridoxamine 5'-phosphate oxidase family protein [uncultured Maribacter sp.]
MNSIFHDGQLAVQKIAGEEDIAIQRIPMLAVSLHPRSIAFIEHQVLAFAGSEDVNGAIWLSLLVGERGFIVIPSVEEIKFDLTKVTSTTDDIFFTNIVTKPTVGLLFHEAARRARYRAWGEATKTDNEISVAIKMGYPSCPKHIQREEIEVPAKTKDALKTSFEKGSSLGDSEKKWISTAHTFFISTQTKKGDIEASHRGGDPGFIEILENGQLRVPDYLGNSMFSTLGNIYENPKAALLFVNYEKGETLQLSGTAALEFDQNSADDFYKSGETGRFWTFETKQWLRTVNHHKVHTEFIDFSPFNILSKK